MGGMGKTTIADAVFQIISDQFENRTYFTGSVRAESEKDISNGLKRLRNKILSKVLNIEKQKSLSPSIPQRFKEMLHQKKVLIVLDDVDNFDQLKILAGGLDELGPGSRIIVTTRDKQVLRNCGMKDHNMHEVKGLNRDEALQLFCNHAFKKDQPTEDFEGLSREMVKIATNVPLAVTVLGSLLYGKGKQYWDDAVDQFQGIMNPTIFDRLKISYNRLDEEEKGLFLDIACFDAVFAFGNLLSNRTCFLDRLIDKSLVIVERGCIKMHDLLREMGRKIVDEESPNKPGDRSRLWRREDVYHMLKRNDGTYAVQGICLNILKLRDVHLISQALKKMYNLRTLIIKHGYLHQASFGDLPDELRYLHWKRFPLEVLPSSFNTVNLVELDLSHSNIKQLWEGRMCVPKLKRLNLFRCRNLIKIPDLSDIPSAKNINLERCISLLEIHSSTKCPKNLQSLQLLYCSNLRSFPSSIHIEGSEFSLYDCISLNKFPNISGNIKRLDLSGSGVEEVPSTILSLSKLERLDMVKCKRLKRISKRICKLKSLDRLDLRGCCKLESFPVILEGMELKYLNLSGTAIKELPPSIGNLNRLEELVLSDYISKLNLYGGSKLEKLPPLSGLCSLKELRLNNSNLTEISEDIGCLSSLEKLELHGNVFERLPKSIKQLSKLYYLSLYNCGMLRSLPELPSSLRYLEAMNCKQLIQSSPDESEIELCADGGGSFIFNFMNCLKLNQEAVSNLFQDSLLKMQLMGTEQIISLFKVSAPPLPPSPFCSIAPPVEEVKVGICLPGYEIPEWFSYKNSGSSINIPVLRNDCGRSRYIMGFAVCLVIGFEGYNVDFDHGCFDVRYWFHTETGDGHKKGFSIGFQIWPFPHTELIGSDHIGRNDIFTILHGSHPDGHKEGFFHYSIAPFIIRPDEHNLLIGSDHILLGYNLSRKCYKFFQELDTLLANRGMSDYTGASFEFNLEQVYYSSNGAKAYEVKHCGIQPIYVQAQLHQSRY